MTTTTMLIVAACILGGIALIYLYFYFSDKRSLAEPAPENASKTVLPLQLQAYERLVLLTDRIAIPNLVSRINQPELNAAEMQQLLTLSIRQEYEHNITQQIYVTKEAWEAVQNYKEQNQLIINQVASFLPKDASANDLRKALMDLLVQNPNASLQTVVAEALQFEARKLMGK